MLTGANATRTNDTNVGATKEVGEPIHSTDQTDLGGSSVWYSWTAPASASVTINTAATPLDTVLAVYTGSAVNALTLVAANDDESFPTISTRCSAFAQPSVGAH